MQHWCFNCSKITFPKAGIKCQYCSSEAIEEMKSQNNPAQHIPYTLPAQPRPQPQPPQVQDAQRTHFTISFIQPMGLLSPPFMQLAPISFIRIITLGEEETQSTPVSDEKF